MLDLKWIREHPADLDAGLERRGFTLDSGEAPSKRILALDEQRRANTTKLQEMQARRNAASKKSARRKARAAIRPKPRR